MTISPAARVALRGTPGRRRADEADAAASPVLRCRQLASARLPAGSFGWLVDEHGASPVRGEPADEGRRVPADLAGARITARAHHSGDASGPASSTITTPRHTRNARIVAPLLTVLQSEHVRTHRYLPHRFGLSVGFPMHGEYTTNCRLVPPSTVDPREMESP